MIPRSILHAMSLHVFFGLSLRRWTDGSKILHMCNENKK